MNLAEEKICGFTVSKERKKVWAVELDMLKHFIEICEKYNLKYFAASGTLIGAIRHKGFIPWDDDVDIIMPREDYKKFLDCAQNELSDNYFLQSNTTEKRYPTGHAQIRNINTACIRPGEYNKLKSSEGNHYGIFIDIFPYDGVPQNHKLRKKQIKKVAFLKKICAMKVYPDSRSKIKFVIKKIMSGLYFCFHSLEKSIEKINYWSSIVPVDKAEEVAVISFAPGYEGNIWKKSYFDETAYSDFCDIKIAIPKYYDEVLSKEYGNYMEIPENKEDGSLHGRCFFDTQNSCLKYKSYTKEQILELCRSAKL